MPARITLDYNNMLAPRLGGRGVRPDRLEAMAGRFATVHETIEKRRQDGTAPAFYDLPGQREYMDRIREFGEGVGQAFDTIVVLGIGGSALGTIAMQQALLRPFWNELTDEQRDYFPRLYVLDNVDPSTVGPLLDRIDVRRTLFNVVSKSGTTAETMAQFLIAREMLIQELDDGYRTHFIFTTDPESGVLRRLAEQEGIPALSVPPGVGGRFSVLSAVGLLPAALAGIDIDALLHGARSMDERCRTSTLSDNPAGLFAVLQYLADTEADAPIHVMMPYSDRLYGVADWFRQLWAESLGKRHDRSGADVFSGPTPVKALGATDQHSQVQLYMEGPFDKTITLLSPGPATNDVAIPQAYPEIDALAYLGGHTLGELLAAERNATASALARAGRMNMTLEFGEVGAETIGQAFMMLQIATIYAGELYDVDPLDQPGVELGKKLTYGLMGRKGHEPPAAEAPDSRYVCG
jgi:glucose-6-phosphate isomerase